MIKFLPDSDSFTEGDSQRFIERYVISIIDRFRRSFRSAICHSLVGHSQIVIIERVVMSKWYVISIIDTFRIQTEICQGGMSIIDRFA